MSTVVMWPTNALAHLDLTRGRASANAAAAANAKAAMVTRPERLRVRSVGTVAMAPPEVVDLGPICE